MSIFREIRAFLDMFKARYRFLIVFLFLLIIGIAVFVGGRLYKNENASMGFLGAATLVGLIAVRDVTRGNGRAIFSRCHLFLSSPSASMPDDTARTSWTEQLQQVEAAIQSHTHVSNIACPTLTYPIASTQERPHRALRNNLDDIRDADYFVAVIPDWGKTAPTSTLIELGIAITLGKKVAIFLKNGLELPYIIKDETGVLGRNLKPISVKKFDSIEDIITDIRDHGIDIFA